MLATLTCVSASPERHAHSESAWSRLQADLASLIAKEVIAGGSSQYVCLDPERTRCLRVATHLGTELLNVTVPTEARWLFEGPSYMKEIYETLRTANGGCDPSANPVPAKTALTPPREEWEESSGKACRLRNGALLAYLDGETEYDSVREETWTHGFFMQPHNDEYYVEKDRAAKEKRRPDSDAFADNMGKDMCLPRLKVPGATTFSEYVDCLQAKALDSVGIAQFANKLSDWKHMLVELKGFERLKWGISLLFSSPSCQLWRL